MKKDMKELISELKIDLTSRGQFAYAINRPEVILRTDLPFPAATDGARIYINPDKFGEYSYEEQKFVYMHEVFHILLEDMVRGKHKIPEVWNIATDAVINYILEELHYGVAPKGCIKLKEEFKGKIAEEIYNELIKDLPPAGTRNEEGDEETESEGGTGESKNSDKETKLTKGNKRFDQHDYSADEKEIKEISAEIRSATRMQGNIPGIIETILKKLFEPKITWEELITTTVSYHIKEHTSFKRIDKRLMDTIIIPRRCYSKSVKLWIAIDTSGSISDEELIKALSELYGLLQQFEGAVTANVIQCDAKVQKVESLQEFINNPKIVGRGGTDFRPIFKYILEQRDFEADILVIFTDGQGTYPDTAPPELDEIVWVGWIDFNPPFGKFVRYNW